jgi:hypothetical protein
VKTLVYARHDLVEATLPADAAALLLEGVWPGDARSPWRTSLDEAIDSRFEWIDLQASHWAEQLGRYEEVADGSRRLIDAVTPAYLNAFALRYYLVKLIRVVAYFTELRMLGPDDALELVAARGKDEDYADLLLELARSTGARLHVRWKEMGRVDPVAPPASGRPRRWMGGLAGFFEPALDEAADAHRTVLCGNPRVLAPVCRELLARGCRVWWLHDRFSLRSWLKWRGASVGQLVCNGSLGRRNHLSGSLPDRLLCREVNLTPALGRWMAERMRIHGRVQTRSIERIESHFCHVQPDSLVVSDDATPLARAAIAVARRHMAASFVMQHGAPDVRFGFAPVAADRFLAWGQSSKRQMIDWGVTPEAIQVTGSPQHDARLEKLRDDVGKVVSGRISSTTIVKPAHVEDAHDLDGEETMFAAAPRQTRILLLGAAPPRDGRPDSVALRFNGHTHAEMAKMTFAAIAKLDLARVVIKTHPRAGRDRAMESAMAAYPSLPVEVVRKGDVESLALRSDCVISFFSSAGVEAAALTGVPVIQVLPFGSGDILPHDCWGLVGSARNESELDRLLRRVMSGDWHPDGASRAEVFDNVDRPAAPRVVDAILTANRQAAVASRERREPIHAEETLAGGPASRP